ncbi:MAG: HMA2 domain-containing protein [Anaerococcus obesiensis]
MARKTIKIGCRSIFKHAIEVKSSIPGRVRFYVPSLESNIEAANDLVEQR